MKVEFVYNGIKFGNGTLQILPHQGDYMFPYGGNIYKVEAVVLKQDPAGQMNALIYLTDISNVEETRLKYINMP